MSRRKHSKIDKLPGPLKDTVDQMIQGDFTYSEIVDFLALHDVEVSRSSVQRYAAQLNATMASLRMAQENFRVIMDEISKYPQLDTTEGIIRLLSHHVLEAVQKTPEEKWADIDPADLIRQGNSLVRAAAYKSHVDLKNKDILDAGYEKVKVLMFETMARENPALYAQVSKFLDSKGGGAE